LGKLDKIIVIGAGPAGLMAAITAAKNGETVLLIEKNAHPAKKLSISGTGQCNFTHDGDIALFAQHYGEKGKIASRILKRFSNEDLINFFKDLGLEIYRREDGKYFPISMRSSDVIDCLLCTYDFLGGKLILNDPVISIEKKETIFLVSTEKKRYTANSVICATGGYTYPKTGSDGQFFSIIENLNHHIVPLGKGLSPIITQDEAILMLTGISFKNAGLLFRTKKGKQLNPRGELLITHRGFSGPLILDNSRYFEKGMKIYLNFTPFQDKEMLEKNMLDYSEEHGKKSLAAFFTDHTIPKRMVNTLFNMAKIDKDIPLSNLTAEDRKKLSKIFAEYPTTIQEMGSINDSMVTTGGITLSEIKLSTMESKIINALYFCGEMIDIDGDTGGYNIQMAFSTGFIAGLAASRRG
jgi:hypothetical protein